jgi:hypothetical protein
LTDDQLNAHYQSFLDELNVGTLAQAKKLSSAKLQRANNATTYNVSLGRFPVGPTVDDTFVTYLASQQLSVSNNNKALNVMTAYNMNEVRSRS